MGEVEVFQRHGADVIIVIHPVGVAVGVAILVRPSVCFQVIPPFHLHILGQNILAVKEHLECSPHLVQRPLTLMERADDGQQHIGIVFDGVEVKMVFVIIVGAGVGVEVSLQVFTSLMICSAVREL